MIGGRSMLNVLALALMPLAFATHAIAETITFETDDTVVVVRSYDQYGTAVVEFIGEAGSIYQCVAFDSAEKPIATTVAMSDMGMIMFENLSAEDVTDVKCRKTM